ncbi:dihydrodipicolinate synthase family protein [Kitasatospora kifunensis]|uniref:4-hydroxy-tetrahydrodipicolinate synthase n=1 Tax=Kitasatospora kifunensis TaxID=58351 RepID=A0A7W7VU21_KITKI|nr:dihydrodipicolinate synthase family protein [Kitasatospora kifunensis]MBB4922005.1 4-hydroxy-tetrahydrodipicolinate synthase [Kitasatospora kifunensis]
MGLFNTPGRWEGMVGCLLTPYDAAGRIDPQTYAKQVRFLAASGMSALCSLMHVGESLNLSMAERQQLTELTVQAADGLPVIAHVSCSGTEHTVALARHAQAVGAQAVVVTAPYHWHPGYQGLLQHFLAVGESIEIPLLAYSPPPAAGAALPTELVAELIERLPNFLGLKEASNQVPVFDAFARLVHRARPDFSVLGGIEYVLPLRTIGAAGSFSICALVAPRLTRSLWTAVVDRDYDRAAGLQQRMNQLLDLLVPRYPATVKAAAEVMGRGLGPTRLPIPPLSAEELSALVVGLDGCGLLDEEPYGWDVDALPDPQRARATASA